MAVEVLAPIDAQPFLDPQSIPLSATTKDASLPSLPLFLQARSHALAQPRKAAIIDTSKKENFTYGQLLSDAASLKATIQQHLRTDTRLTEEPRVAFLVPAGYDYVVTQWAIWAAGAICVPMCMFPKS